MDRAASKTQKSGRPLINSENSTNWRERGPTTNNRSKSPHFSAREEHGRVADARQSEQASPKSEQTDAPQPTSNDLQDSPAVDSLDNGRRLCVANLLYMVKHADIESFFAENGHQIDRIDMSVDPFTGRNPSYCFVDFSSPELADLALVSLNGKTLLGRPVKVRPAVHKLDKQGNSYYGKRFAGRPHNAYDSLKGAVPTFDRWKRHDAAEHYDGYAEQGRRVYVGGLPRMAHQAAVDEEVRELFGAFKIEAVSKIISPHANKGKEPGNHYYVFVDFPDSEQADAACRALDGMELKWGGRLRVSHAKGNSWKPEERQRWDVQRGGGQ